MGDDFVIPISISESKTKLFSLVGNFMSKGKNKRRKNRNGRKSETRKDYFAIELKHRGEDKVVVDNSEEDKVIEDCKSGNNPFELSCEIDTSDKKFDKSKVPNCSSEDIKIQIDSNKVLEESKEKLDDDFTSKNLNSDVIPKATEIPVFDCEDSFMGIVKEDLKEGGSHPKYHTMRPHTAMESKMNYKQFKDIKRI